MTPSVPAGITEPSAVAQRVRPGDRWAVGGAARGRSAARGHRKSGARLAERGEHGVQALPGAASSRPDGREADVLLGGERR